MLCGPVLTQVVHLLVLLVTQVTLVWRLRRVRCEMDVKDGTRDKRLVAGGTAERRWDQTGVHHYLCAA